MSEILELSEYPTKQAMFEKIDGEIMKLLRDRLKIDAEIVFAKIPALFELGRIFRFEILYPLPSRVPRKSSIGS